MISDHKAARHPLRFIVVGHDISSNALGRAISLSLVANEIGPTLLLAFGAGKPWKGSSQFDVPVGRLSKDWKAELLEHLHDAGDARNIIWLSKGIAPLHEVAQFVSTADPNAAIFLDLDDDDAGLAESFAKRSLLNRVRLHPLRRGNPGQIRRTQRLIARHASGFTFSTNALASRFPETFKPMVRIPHVRRDSQRTVPDDRRARTGVTFGSFGTLRPHKGSDLLLQLMRHDRSLTLVTFADCGLGKPQPQDGNWLEIPSNTPLPDAYSLVDVAVIPITESNSGAQYQLPAKLIDSLQAGVAILATSTPAIEEIAGGAFAALEQTSDAESISSQIRTLANQESGQNGRERFLELLTPKAAAKNLCRLLASTPHPTDPR